MVDPKGDAVVGRKLMSTTATHSADSVVVTLLTVLVHAKDNLTNNLPIKIVDSLKCSQHEE